MPPPRRDDEVRPITAVRSGLLAFARPAQAEAPERTWVVLIDDEAFTLRLENERVRATSGAAEHPDVVARAKPAALLGYRISRGRRRPPLKFVTGSAADISEFEAVFDLRAGQPAAR